MKARALGMLAAIAAVGAVVTAPTAAATGCSSGQICLWSGTGYTGTMVALTPEHPWGDCVSAAELGLSAIRSAKKNAVDCQFQAALHRDGGCGASTEPAFVGNETPTISPAALSLQQITIPC